MKLLLFVALLGTSCAFSISRLSAVSQVLTSRVSTRLAVASSTDEEISSDTTQPTEAQSSDGKIRPLHQNWWPVTATYALDPSRPNPIELLSMKLVLFKNSAGEWKCLQDRCAHRFAPLSEGRIVESEGGKSCLQCAYHGWEFGDDGSCQKVPQAESRSTKPVQSYPVRVEAGMVFVWADPDTSGESIPIPTFPLLDQWVEARGENACFMRDLPYGYELLAENLLDLAHLPFSHHGVGGLSRDLGCPLPLKMLSASQKSADSPLYEAMVEDAASTDPSLKGRTVPADSTTTIAFYEPNHVRYTRKTPLASCVVLFLCPLSPTRSRVCMFNVMEAMLLQPPPQEKSKRQVLKEWVTPSVIKSKIQKSIMAKIFTPVWGHMMGHQIFDGDGIFLHMQGDRMEREGLTYRDYETSSADVLVNAFRRYLQSAVELTRKAGKDKMADAAASPHGYDSPLPRSQMLDRYESHTKNCNICAPALAEKQSKKGRLSTAQAILLGSVGASATVLAGAALVVVTSEAVIPATVLGTATIALASTVGASVAASKAQKKLDKEIQSFFFEDYVHADKK